MIEKSLAVRTTSSQAQVDIIDIYLLDKKISNLVQNLMSITLFFFHHYVQFMQIS